MSKNISSPLRWAIPMLLAAVLAAGPINGFAKGQSGGGHGPSAGKSHANEPGADSPAIRPTFNLRSSSSSSSSSSIAEGQTPGSAVERTSSAQPQSAGPALDEEEEARRAANLARQQRIEAEKAAAAKAAADRSEAYRLAAEKAAAARAAQAAAEERAAAAKVAAAREKKRAEQAEVAADVERVLQRARSDYPVLATADGEPLLRKIIDRQQELAARGVYPGVAMVEAISDHAHALVPRQGPELRRISSDQSQSAQPRTFDNCRWVTSIKWSCD